jgi:hypothetical protein
MPLVLIIKNKIYKNTCSRGEPWACYENNFNMGEKLGAIFARPSCPTKLQCNDIDQ